MHPPEPIVRLKPGHVQPVWTGHPWVFAQAIDDVRGGATPGDVVRVEDPRGGFLGRGFYSPKSAIAVRVVTREAELPIDAAFFRTRIHAALTRRLSLGLGDEATDGYRLVHSEGDGLPGLIVDRFRDVLVVQLLTIGMKLREAMVLEALSDVIEPRAIVDRTPEHSAKAEGFARGEGVVRGTFDGELCFRERGFDFRLPKELGQKTGYYFDQRGLRARVEQLARGKRVLDAYSYVGAFGLAAARGGARDVVCVDDSAIAIEVGATLARENKLPDVMAFAKHDARAALREAHSSYDLVVCDPPRLAPSKASRDQAQKAYAELAKLATSAVKPGGLLVFCSCSAAVDMNALTRALAVGAQRSNTTAVVLERHFQGFDHPVGAAFPEGLYLKALIAEVLHR